MIRTPLQVSLSVWKALFLREAVNRLAAGRAAWVWLLLEPIAQVAFLMVLFSALRHRGASGPDFAMFLAVGVIGFQLFRNPAQRAMGAISSNAALFAYRQVRPVDAVLIRTILEGFLQLIVALALMLACGVLGFDVMPVDPLLLFLSAGVLWSLGTALGLILSVGGELVPEIAKVAQLAFTPLYFLSGVMFSPHIVPPALRDWLLVNPVVHGIEVMRVSYFDGYHQLPGIELQYPAAVALFLSLIGLALHVRYARKLVSL